MRHAGLTLIEVMAVVALLGIMAAATAWSMAEDVRRGDRQSAVTQIQYADRMARIASDRLGGRCVLRIDLDEQQLRRVSVSESGDELPAHGLKLPRDCRIGRVIFPGNSQDSGTVEIAYSSGRSIGYALELDFGAHDKQWLVFCGLTGQMVTLDDEQQVDNLFQALAGTRDDAD